MNLISRTKKAKAAEDTLQDREELLRAIFESTQDAIIILDDKMRCLRANPGAGIITGMHHEQLVGRFLPEFVDAGFDLSAAWSAFIQTGRFAGEVEIKHIEGDFRIVEATGIANILPGKHMFIWHDITERKKTEESLRQSQEKYRQLVQSSGSIVLRVDKDMHITFINQYGLQFFGYSPEEIIGKSALGIIMPLKDEKGHDLAAMAEDLIKRPDNYPTNAHQNKRKDGSLVWISWTNKPIYDNQGNLVEVLSIGNDLSKLKETEAALHESEERYRRLFEDDLTGDFIALPDGQILICNPAFVKIFGFSSREEVMGSNLSQLHLSPEEFADFIKLICEHKTLERYESDRRRRDGTTIHIIENIVGTFNERGELIQFKGYVFNDTERKQNEEALRWNKERAEILSEVTSRLLSIDRPQEIVNDLCRKVMDFLDCHAFFNYLADENKGCLHLNAYAGIPDEKAEDIEWLDYGVAVCGCAARDGVRIVAEDIPETSDPRTELVKSFGIRAYACHPLISEGQIIGTLSFGTRSKTKFSDDDLAMMRAVADHIALAIARTRNEEALKESEEKFRALADATPNIVFVYRGNRILYVNPAAVSISGYSKEELLTMDFIDIIQPDYRNVIQEGIKMRIEGYRGLKHYELKIIKKTGEERWLDVSANLISYEGSPAGIVTCMDITDRKRAEEELRKSKNELEIRVQERTAELEESNWALQESESRYHSLFNAMSSGAAIYDVIGDGKDFIFKDINPAGERIDQVKRAEVVGKSLYELFPNVREMGVDEVFRRVWKTGLPESFPITAYTDDRLSVWVTNYVYRLPSGELVAVWDDITEQKQLDEALQRANKNLELTNKRLQEKLEEHQKLKAELIRARDAAEAAAEAKAAFMANMSHELRTPMNYIIGMTSLLLEEPLTPELKDYVETIRQGGNEMMALINSILDFDKVKKDKLVLEYQPLSLRSLADESIEMVASQATRKCLSHSSNIKYGTPERIIGDYGRLRQILANLLSNAIKFTDEGEISLSVSSKPLQKANKHQILFAVKDTGIGIPSEKMSELFEPFAQVEMDISRKRDGVGLSLAINKKLVELMGGEIWARSEIGKGSTFYVTIEAEIAKNEDIKAESEKTIKAIPEELAEKHPLSILIAEDIASNQKVLLEMLKRMGYRADAVADGKEVLQALDRRHYDLILMDVKMPEMDGIEAAKEIRRRWPDNGPKIIAITAYALHGDKEKCLEAGMDGYIPKPVQKEDLAEVIANYRLGAS